MIVIFLFISVVNVISSDEDLKLCNEGHFRQSDSSCALCTLFCFSKELTPEQTKICLPFCSTTLYEKPTTTIHTPSVSTILLPVKDSPVKYLYTLIPVLIVIVILVCILIFCRKNISRACCQPNRNTDLELQVQGDVENDVPEPDNGRILEGNGTNSSASERATLLVPEQRTPGGVQADEVEPLTFGPEAEPLTFGPEAEPLTFGPGPSDDNPQSSDQSLPSPSFSNDSISKKKLCLTFQPFEDDHVEPLEGLLNSPEENGITHPDFQHTSPSLTYSPKRNEPVGDDSELLTDMVDFNVDESPMKVEDIPDTGGVVVDPYEMPRSSADDFNSLYPTPLSGDYEGISDRPAILSSLSSLASIQPKDIKMKHNEPKRLPSIVEKTDSLEKEDRRKPSEEALLSLDIPGEKETFYSISARSDLSQPESHKESDSLYHTMQEY